MLNEGEKYRCWMNFHRVCDERCIAFVEPAVHTAWSSCGLLNAVTAVSSSLKTIARSTEGPMSGTQPPPGGPR